MSCARFLYALYVIFLTSPLLYGQVTITGVVSAASWATPVAPGSVVAIFGTQLAAATAAASGYPLPINIEGTSVTVNGVSAHLYFVSPGQINAQLPSLAEYATPASESVVVTSSAGISASFAVPTHFQVPAAFTSNSSGCGQVAALNITPAGVVSMNLPSNSAQPGDYLAVFGTGFGPPAQPVADGTASPVLKLVTGVSARLGNSGSAVITYQGLAPSFAGVDQINMLIPVGTQEGCAIPLTFQGALYPSPTVAASVHTGRGRCVDPQPTHYGQLILLSTVGISDNLTAVFPSGPNVQPPTLLIQNAVGQITPPSVSRSCTVPGYTNISAGTISIQGPGSTAATVTPQIQAWGVDYDFTLPAGFVAAGQYTVSSAPNQPATFSGKFTVGPPIRLLSMFPGGTALSARDGFTVRWEGGDPDDLVRIRLVSRNGLLSATNTYWSNVGAGSITLAGACTPGTPIGGSCFWPGLASSVNAELIIDVLPPGGVAMTSGVTQFIWDYRYVFDSLSLGA
jgi:uncharacterized protein (TIGR03437 family)